MARFTFTRGRLRWISADDSESRFAAYVEGLTSVIGHADRAGPLRRTDDALRAQERGADDGAGAEGGAEPVAVAFRQQCGVVGRGGAAGDGAARSDRSGWRGNIVANSGKQDNCQVAVSLANHHASLPVAYRLYLPQDWVQDRERRRKTGVPEDIGIMTKPQIALEQVRFACAAWLPRATWR